MAVKIQNFPKKNFGQPEFTLSCPSGWNSNEQRTQQALCKNISFSLEPAHQLCYKAKHLGLQIPDQKSSPTLSIGQSQNEVGAVGGTKSQDQCISSESGHDQSCGKGMKSNMKPFFLLSSADVALATSHADSSHSVASAPYPCADPYFHGMLGPYGPQAIIQPQMAPQMARMTATRVPLPFSIADEGPIYVNAKQYHGILRRRQSRAKLEAQNKLFKTRKPYLHESRHRHALNRVRGTGGRFLGTKKLQQCNPGPNTNVDSVSETIYVHQRNTKFERETSCSGTGQSGASNTNTGCSDLIGVSNSDVIIRPPDSLFSGISVPVGRRM